MTCTNLRIIRIKEYLKLEGFNTDHQVQFLILAGLPTTKPYDPEHGPGTPWTQAGLEGWLLRWGASPETDCPNAHPDHRDVQIRLWQGIIFVSGETRTTSFHTDSSQSFLSRTGISVLKPGHKMGFLKTKFSPELKCFSECFYLLNESWIPSLFSTLFQIKKIRLRAVKPLYIPLNYHNIGPRTQVLW